jgi:hypothetical protein
VERRHLVLEPRHHRSGIQAIAVEHLHHETLRAIAHTKAADADLLAPGSGAGRVIEGFVHRSVIIPLVSRAAA